MIRTILMAFELMTPAARRQLVLLIPLMVLASSSDVLTVVFGASFLRTLSPDAASPFTLYLGEVLGDPTYVPPVMVTSMFLLVVVANAVSMYATYRVNDFGFGQVVHLSESTLSALVRRPYAWFLQQSTPQLKQQALVETQRVVTILIVQVAQIASRLVGALVIVLYLLWEDPYVTVMLTLVLSVFYGGLYALIRQTMFRYGRKRSLTDKQRHKVVEETLVGVKELKLHGLEDKALERFHAPSLAYARSLVVTGTLSTAAKPALEVVGMAGLVGVVVIFHFTDRSLAGVLTLLGTYAIAAYRLLPTMQRMFATAMRVQVERHALESIYAHITEPEPEVNLADEPALPFEEGLRLDDLTFQYAGTDTPVLDHLSLEIEKGSWVALVGSTGSGKTTLVDLMMGLLEPTKGELRVDGTLVQGTAKVKRWQEHLGYVPQNLFMSDTTIAGNIAFGAVEADLDRVKRSADMACISDYIENDLPDGYQTEIGERGMRVSGGQRQRLGIARALYRAPDMLVLDEATSALDNRTEAAVMEALRTNFAETTVLMIAHRLSTTRHCDRIFILEQGRLLDSGSYDELMERSAYFRQMVEASKDAPSST